MYNSEVILVLDGIIDYNSDTLSIVKKSLMTMNNVIF